MAFRSNTLGLVPPGHPDISQKHWWWGSSCQPCPPGLELTILLAASSHSLWGVLGHSSHFDQLRTPASQVNGGKVFRRRCTWHQLALLEHFSIFSLLDKGSCSQASQKARTAREACLHTQDTLSHRPLVYA